jgi:hypothetical protein
MRLRVAYCLFDCLSQRLWFVCAWLQRHTSADVSIRAIYIYQHTSACALYIVFRMRLNGHWLAGCSLLLTLLALQVQKYTRWRNCGRLLWYIARMLTYDDIYIARMLTYADVCLCSWRYMARMLKHADIYMYSAYADVCWRMALQYKNYRMLTNADIYKAHMLTNAGVCLYSTRTTWLTRYSAYADVCWRMLRMLTYADVWLCSTRTTWLTR